MENQEVKCDKCGMLVPRDKVTFLEGGEKLCKNCK